MRRRNVESAYSLHHRGGSEPGPSKSWVRSGWVEFFYVVGGLDWVGPRLSVPVYGRINVCCILNQVHVVWGFRANKIMFVA